MPKYYLHRTGKIPTAVHPFVKQRSFREDKQKAFLNQREIIQGWQNNTSSTFRKISLMIARLIRNEP